MLINKENSLSAAAAKAGVDEKTARKYLKTGKLPSQVIPERTWRTRPDPFESVWSESKSFLWNPGIEAKTVFQYLQGKYPGQFQDGQLRTFQRKVKRWRAVEGPPKEVFFPQQHYPGNLSASDFTSMNKLEVTINREKFDHLLFHFILTYSNWETGTICFSESFESLLEGLQNAFWKLGGVSKKHRTDNLSAAIYKDLFGKVFTNRYRSFLNYYGLQGETINVGKSNENGDIEQSHNRFKKAVEQALMLRGSRDFFSRQEYEIFIEKIFSQLNCGRSKRFTEELEKLKRLPEMRLEDYRRFTFKKVGPSSTIHIYNNVYSVDSRLIGEAIEARLYSGHVEIWYGQKRVDSFPRLRGEKKHRIEYRHIIDWLVRKPGAFENYRYRNDLFPTIRFRMAYDFLKKHTPARAAKEYTQILYLAAKESESGVDKALEILFDKGEIIRVDTVKTMLKNNHKILALRTVKIKEINLSKYDRLLSYFEKEGGHHEISQ